MLVSTINKQNRSRAERPASNPSTESIRAARTSAGLTQKQAGELIMCTGRAWEKWESGERRMHPAFFAYFLIKTGQK